VLRHNDGAGEGYFERGKGRQRGVKNVALFLLDTVGDSDQGFSRKQRSDWRVEGTDLSSKEVEQVRGRTGRRRQEVFVDIRREGPRGTNDSVFPWKGGGTRKNDLWGLKLAQNNETRGNGRV